MDVSLRIYQRRRAAGLCVECGIGPPVSGGVTCEACRARRRAYWHTGGACNEDCDNCKHPDCIVTEPLADRYRAKRAEYYMARKMRLKAAGLCSVCGKVQPPPGYVTCEACRERYNSYKRKSYQGGGK